ncbi:MAG: flagellar hook-basal body protein [Ignavibacteriales bacterium]|jgi:flagellar basal-body rod protein FlgF|nr:flagellar hook-basal body protein [Ignavibacteriales bacterium]MBK7980563.1 flagellar hook-basal body protein [Ignavibacteriota bacterium]
MIKGLYNASKSMNDKIHNIQIVANNLANLSTNGFKREIPFAEYMERAENQDMKHVTDFSEGEFIETDNPLDFAISGKAFFAVNTERGIELTKNGQFEIDKEGFLATKDGYRVLGDKGNINLDETLVKSNGELTITEDGQIKAGKFLIDNLRIVNVENPELLERSENQTFYYEEQDFTNVDRKDFKIHQGFIEGSNTNPILEMQAMIQLQKDFEASQKMITSLDGMLSQSKEIGKY